MSVTIDRLITTIDKQLQPGLFEDYCPNGLQVEGEGEISTLITGVTASQALIDRAIDEGADAILVHHGFFWKGENPCLTGMKGRRLRSLIKRGVYLLAYHLPLDAHPELGNNAQLAKRLGLEVEGGLQAGNALSIGNVGRLQKPLTASQFSADVSRVLGRECLLVEGGEHLIETIGWCTGAAQNYIDQAAERGVDAYLSGEISEPTVHSARELGVHYLAAGHHATERYGVLALGEYLAEQLGIDHRFVDIDSPA